MTFQLVSFFLQTCIHSLATLCKLTRHTGHVDTRCMLGNWVKMTLEKGKEHLIVNQFLINKSSSFIQRHHVSDNMLLVNHSLCVSGGLLGLAWHFAHHQDLLQGFLNVLVHLTLDSIEEVHSVN